MDHLQNSSTHFFQNSFMDFLKNPADFFHVKDLRQEFLYKIIQLFLSEIFPEIPPTTPSDSPSRYFQNFFK